MVTVLLKRAATALLLLEARRPLRRVATTAPATVSRRNIGKAVATATRLAEATQPLLLAWMAVMG